MQSPPLPDALVCRGIGRLLRGRGVLRQPAIYVHTNSMEHRGVRYVIRIGIARGQWQVAVYLPGKKFPKETTVVGTRQAAEAAASSIINAWLKKRLRENTIS